MSGIYYKNKERANVTEINKSGATATEDASTITVNGTTYGVKRSLSDLTDTAITSPSDGDVLQYDGSASKWVNVTWTAFKAKLKTYFDTIYATISSLAAHATVPLDNTTLKIGSDGSDSAVYSACTKSTYYPSTSTLSLATKTAYDVTALQDVFIPQVDITEKSDTTPYIYRPSVANGDRVNEEYVGASVGWNQLCPLYTSENVGLYNTSYANKAVSDGVATITFTQSASASFYVFGMRYSYANPIINIIQGHKYYISFKVKPSFTATFGSETFENYLNANYTKQCPANQWTTVEFERNAPNDRTSNCLIYFNSPDGGSVSSGQSYQVKEFMIIDLTVLLGTTIADYAYSLGSASAIAWYRRFGFLTKSYYPYNAGELLSAEVWGKKYVGKNLFDDNATIRAYDVNTSGAQRAGYVLPIIAGKTYTISAQQGGSDVYIDAEFHDNGTYTYIGRIVSTTTVNTITFTATKSCDLYIYDAASAQTAIAKPRIQAAKIQLEFGNTATTYEPYHATTYTLGTDTLRGIFKLVDNKIVADGDVKTSEGKIVRKHGIITLTGASSEQWYKSSVANNGYYYSLYGIMKTGGVALPSSHFVYSSDPVDYRTKDWYLLTDNSICISLPTSVASDVNALKTWLASNPLTVVYELLNPTTEQSSSFTLPQICDKNGTEEFITDGIVPVGHESTYYNYPDYMEEGEYKDFRDRVDYAPEKAKWHQVGIYAIGDTITIDGYYNEIMLVPNHYSGTTLLACASPAIFPFSLFKSITLQNSTESERIDITPAGVVGVTGTYFSNVTIFVR